MGAAFTHGHATGGTVRTFSQVAGYQKYFQSWLIDTKKEFVGFQQNILAFPGEAMGFGSISTQNSNIFPDFRQEDFSWKR